MEGKKRVLIISKSHSETSTERVLDWVTFLGHDCQRLNGDTFEEYLDHAITISSNHGNLKVDMDGFSLTYDSIWFRRWSDYSFVPRITSFCENINKNSLATSVLRTVASDVSTIEVFIRSMISAKKTLTSNSQIHTNKLTNLILGSKCGLNCPEFIITTKKVDLISFSEAHENKVMLKDIDVGFWYVTKNKYYSSYGVLLEKGQLNVLPEIFPLSFFQRYIDKKYEIRTFFLNAKFYSMAIFSQHDNQTKIDMRRYNFSSPNRMVPYNLPIEVEDKLKTLMNNLDLSTGSIDLIKGKDGEYYFLEVNPVGQYGLLVELCNYNLDFEIAKYLIYD